MWTEPAKLRIGLEIFVESFLDVKKKKRQVQSYIVGLSKTQGS